LVKIYILRKLTLNDFKMKNLFRVSRVILLLLLIILIHSCKKEKVPTLRTYFVTEISGTRATSGGTITSEGSGTVTARGVCWSTSTTPTVDDNKTSDGAGAGDFSSNITGLEEGTFYYVRAYATNSIGTNYGDQVNFKTLSYGPIVFNSNLTYGTITDIDGNLYRTIQIGSQVWMAENLKTTKYNDSNSIPLFNADAWGYSTPAYCFFNNDSYSSATQGALYNWYTVNTNKLCPSGWHVPSDAEWTILITYLGGESVAGGKLKEIGTTHWNAPNTGATNESGFTALPVGWRNEDAPWTGKFEGIGYSCLLWSSTENSAFSYDADYLVIYNSYSRAIISYDHKPIGGSVRCIKNN
jgi:uncharacterized protein (TIGR02145 family)